MADDLHERLTDYLSRMETGPFRFPADGIVKINAESMADALLPFIHAEIAAELERLLGGQPAPSSSWATTVLGRVQIRLQQLHDGVSHERKAP